MNGGKRGDAVQAREIMSSPVLTVTPETPVRDAVQLMLGNHISGLPVVDAQGHLVGIISEADLLPKASEPKPAEPLLEWSGPWLWLERWLGGHRKAAGRTVGEVMTRHVVTATEETPVGELAARMVHHQVNRLPIVRGREVVGIVTRADILKVFLRPDAELAAEARQAVEGFLWPTEEVRVTVRRGVLTVRGHLASPGRRATLLQRLEQITGLIAVDAADLDHAFPAHVRASGE
ncbi:MAG: CBS domain-containing protein [Armatimonadota bacterium]|nr:CBS domain-containing protein [Armatimonadota bacterium]MDR7427894.1 CBS domain-containing protein [Armatimonadota bacterium]MDR7463897.1 CBS domain-containing protein [Armatimonadota bacterium]MDR7470067.1 CBS domain-containing protein [Armatimonadota bacterium]MDR7474411.1 CBS domain-containing protein [Armatimonadota bacterium]